MSAFAEKDFDAELYNITRPIYPNEFFQMLDEYHQGRRDLLIDVGCGPGIATIQLNSLLKGFNRVIGTDISPTMIEQANKSASKVRGDQISFYTSSGDDFSFLGPKEANTNAVDLITAAECVHYFDFKRFQEKLASNLRSGGTVAIFGYGDAIFLDYPKTDAIINNVSYGDDKLGPYWDEPGRTIAREMLASWRYDPNLFTDIRDFTLHATTLRSSPTSQLSQKPLLIIKEMTVADYAANIRTWSGYHSWYKEKSGSQPELGDEFVKDVIDAYPELTPYSKVRVAYSTYYKIARRV